MAKYPKMKKISWKTFQILICWYTHSIRVKSTHLLAPPTCCITEDKIRIKISFTTFYLFIILQLFYLFALIYFYYFVAFFLQTSVCLICENFGPRKSMFCGKDLMAGQSVNNLHCLPGCLIDTVFEYDLLQVIPTFPFLT